MIHGGTCLIFVLNSTSYFLPKKKGKHGDDGSYYGPNINLKPICLTNSTLRGINN